MKMAEVVKMRTIRQCAKYFKEVDPETAVTEHALRIMVKEGAIPIFKTGNRHLINLDKLIDYFNCELPDIDEAV